MHISQEDTRFGSVITAEVGGRAKDKVLLLGGWEQNPERMREVQQALAIWHHISSIGISAFDTIDPVPDISIPEALGYKTDDPLLTEIPPRMLRRAHILNYMSTYVLEKAFEPERVITHCSGANVFLLAQYLQAQEDEFGLLPTRGVLAEPMLAETITPRTYFASFARHERKADEDDSYISLRRLSCPSEEGFKPEKGRRPVEDIVASRGTTLFIWALENDMDLQVMFSDSTDYAANEAHIRQELPEEYHHQLHSYANQQRHGHGYLLDSPERALKDIVPLLWARD